MKKLLSVFLFFNSFICFSQNYVLYGVTSYGILGSAGVLFCYEPYTNKYFVLDYFNNSNGPEEALGGSLIQDTSTGYIYGLTRLGGSFGNGTIFRYKTANNDDTVIYSFNTPTGIEPLGSITLDSDGILYGLTSYFDIYNGVFFSYDLNTNNYTDLFGFDTANGASPLFCQPLLANDGKIYGMTPYGGTNGIGVLFRYDPVLNKDTIVISFNSTNGAYPAGSVIQASNGLIYGMTNAGGTNNYGVLFSYNPITYKDTILFNFGTTYYGYDIESDLYQASNGILYAIIPYNSSGLAEIFSYNPINGNDTTIILNHGELFSPNSNNDLVQDPDDGLLYGTTSAGGDSDVGTLFSFNPSTFKDSVLVNFHFFSTGRTPVGRLLLSKSKPDSTAGVHKLLSIEEEVNIYPNPNNGIFTVSLSHAELVSASQATIEVYNILGENVYTATLKQVQGDYEINMSSQPSGVYFYRVLNESGTLLCEGKVIVEK